MTNKTPEIPKNPSPECYKCEGSFQNGDRVLVHKRFGSAAAFHDICRAPHRDYVVIIWPPSEVQKGT